MHGECSVTVTQQFVALPISVRLAAFPPLNRDMAELVRRRGVGPEVCWFEPNCLEVSPVGRSSSR